MRPTKLSSKVFLELPPVLAHYLEGERNPWLEAVPSKGKISLLNRAGTFSDLEALAVERRQLIHILGFARARATCYSIGFEQGRRDAARHYGVFARNARLALQAGPVFAQLQGRFIVEPVKLEFDLDQRTLYGELVLHSSTEALRHRMAVDEPSQCACWGAAGYISGHVSEIVGTRVLTLETQCLAKGDRACRLISRLDPEWGDEADWIREALRVETVEEELAEKEQLVATAHKAAHQAQQALTDLNRRFQSDLMLEGLVAEAESMVDVVKVARQVMNADVPVLVVGEPGVGKETIARTIHFGGARKSGPFVPVDSSGLSEDLVTQQLFGFTKGAFPGAVRGHKGAYAQAHRGTLYLDELTSLSLEAQGLLLRAMEEGQVLALGADKPERADVRVIAATQFDPIEKRVEGTLREDLNYALAVGRIDVPPLRERSTDTLLLAEHFIQQCCERYGRPRAVLSEEIKQALLDCAWPGNVRQLRNVIEWAVVMSQSQELGTAHLPEEVLATRWRHGPKELTSEVVRAALGRCKGNRSRAAQLLGIGRTTLWRVMKRLDLD